jgi:hypothetical protein
VASPPALVLVTSTVDLANLADGLALGAGPDATVFTPHHAIDPRARSAPSREVGSLVVLVHADAALDAVARWLELVHATEPAAEVTLRVGDASLTSTAAHAVGPAGLRSLAR